MDTLNLKIAKEAYQKVIENPTNDNKIWYIYHHKPYIITIMKKYLHKDYFDYEDTISDCMLKAYKAVNTFDFCRGYIDCKNLLSTVISNHCKNMYAYRDASRRIPAHLIGSFNVNNHEEQDIYDAVITNKELANDNYESYKAESIANILDGAQVDKMDILFEHAEDNPLIKDILVMYCDGWTYGEIGQMLGKSDHYPVSHLTKFTQKLQKLGVVKPMGDNVS